MALSDLLLNRTSTPGLWFVKSKDIIKDISQQINNLAVNGGMFFQIYSSHKERIVNTVISITTKDRLLAVTDPADRFMIENDISYYYDTGHFLVQDELNELIPNGSFWAFQVMIQNFDPLFLGYCEKGQVIFIDDINAFNRNYEASLTDTLRHLNRLAIEEQRPVFVFVHENASELKNDFISCRLI